MIVSFHSTLLPVEIRQPILKGTRTSVCHLVGVSICVFNPPIDLKPNDCVLVDVRNGNVELIQRGHITIWHPAWKN